MGKKRSGSDFKIEVKDEIVNDSNVLMARDRFKGALRELLHHSEESTSDESSDETMEEYRSTPKKLDRSSDSMSRTRPMQSQPRRLIKRRRPIHLDSAFHHTYVMKLFDRSVDLAQFEEDTPLYPICRAWMANQPRNPNFATKARSPSPEVERNDVITPKNMFDDTGDIRDVLALPEPFTSEEAFPKNRIPSPHPVENEELDLNYEGKILKSKETLMSSHREHWLAVRKKWHKQSHKNEKRFAESAAILGTIFKRAQSEFD